MDEARPLSRRYEALRASVEAERKEWARERKMMERTIEALRKALERAG